MSVRSFVTIRLVRLYPMVLLGMLLGFVIRLIFIEAQIIDQAPSTR